MIETMQFRDYIFSHNPARITVWQPSELAAHFCPGKGDIVQQLGAKARTVQCEGSFCGASFREAMDELQRFRRHTADGGRGMLLVPGQPPFMALLKQFIFDAQGDGRIIPYTMLFMEAQR